MTDNLGFQLARAHGISLLHEQQVIEDLRKADAILAKYYGPTHISRAEIAMRIASDLPTKKWRLRWNPTIPQVFTGEFGKWEVVRPNGDVESRWRTWSYAAERLDRIVRYGHAG